VKRRSAASLRIVLAVLLLAGVLWLADVRAVARVLAAADWRWLVLGVLSAVSANVASALRWWVLVKWLGGDLGKGWALALYFRGVAINALLPGAVIGGDMYRAHALARRGLALPEAGVSVLFDRLSGLWVLLVVGCLFAAFGLQQRSTDSWLPALGLPLLPAFVPLAAGALLLTLPLGVLMAWRAGVAVPQTLGDPGTSSWHNRLALIAHRPQAMAQYGWQLLGSLAVQLLSVGTLACGGAALGVGLPYWAWAVAAVPTFLLATLPVSFGGWGTREAAAVLSLGAFGVAAPQAVAVSMLYGLAALAQALGGGATLLTFRRGD
jgi:glycosyltransferase 2 family protein